MKNRLLQKSEYCNTEHNLKVVTTLKSQHDKKQKEMTKNREKFRIEAQKIHVQMSINFKNDLVSD